MKKNFLFGVLAVLLAGFGFGGISMADCTNTEQGDNEASLLAGENTYYCSLSDAVAAAQNGNTVTLLKNIALTSDVTVNKSITLDLDGNTISFTNSRFRFGGTIEAIITGSGTVTSNMVAMNVGTTSDHTTKVIIKNGTFEAGAHCIQVYGELEVEDATIQSTATYPLATNNQTAILFADSAKGTLKGGVYSSVAISGQALTITNSDVTIDSATVTSAHVGIDLNQRSKLTISGGNITAENNCAVFMNGTDGRGGNNLIINGGTFIGNIHSEGEIACGVAAFNDDTVEINGGTFNITDGVGIVARGGTTILGENVSFNISNPSRTSGKVGNSSVIIPVGYEMVMDVASDYPGAATTFITTNNLTGTYLVADNPYVVSIKNDDEVVPLTLTKDGASAMITKPTPDPEKDGYTFSGWYNGDVKYEFTENVSADTILLANWDGPIQYIITWNYKNSSGEDLTDTGAVAYNEVPTHASGSNYETDTTLYTFSGWTPEIVAATGDATYTATYQETAKASSGSAAGSGSTSGSSSSSSTSSGGGGSASSASSTTDSTDNSKTDENTQDNAQTNEDGDGADNNGNPDSQKVLEDGFTQEFHDAYDFAFKNGITTMPSIAEADMNGTLTRIAMAKMLSQYAINVLKKEPDPSRTISFPDVSPELDAQYNSGVTLAYQLGIMGIGIEEFRPFDEVTRAEFVTALSRLLFGTPDGENLYYETHMQKLLEEKIITVTDPNMKELRGYVMIMLMRSATE